MVVHVIKQDWCLGEMKANSYVVEFDKFLILVDASAPISNVKEISPKPIRAVLITHGHFDHIMNIKDYDRLSIPIYANEHITELVSNADKNVSTMVGKPQVFEINNLHTISKDTKFSIGGIEIKSFYTPGHSIDSTSYLIGDELFTGDTLFSVAVGRVDLPTSKLDDLITSLDKIRDLEYSDLYSGHGRISNKTEQQYNIDKWQNELKEMLNKKENI